VSGSCTTKLKFRLAPILLRLTMRSSIRTILGDRTCNIPASAKQARSSQLRWVRAYATTEVVEHNYGARHARLPSHDHSALDAISRATETSDHEGLVGFPSRAITVMGARRPDRHRRTDAPSCIAHDPPAQRSASSTARRFHTASAYLCIPLSSLLMPYASARTIERRRETSIVEA
jgi:hypothetical protein